MAPMIGACVSLSWQILQLLLTSKGNKQEQKSLQSAVTNINRFLKAITADGVSDEGNEVLKQLHTQLLEVHSLLVEVGNMSKLVALLKADRVRDDFLRTNRDLINTFTILAQGEQLLVLQRGASITAEGLKQIKRDLQCSQAEFFVMEEAQHSRLMDMASRAKHNHVPEQLLQRDLLEELKELPEVAGLGPEELLAEFRALQELALESYNSQDDASTDDARTSDQKTKGKISGEAEEYLLQQVCAAIAASVHAATPEVLLLDAPPDYVCPISKQLMVHPMLLVETGHTYEAAAIQKWLESSNLCPVSGAKLTSKQTAPNYSLKRVIADWAAAHSVTLPPAPTYNSEERPRSGPSATEVPAPAVSMHGSSRSSRHLAPSPSTIIDIDDCPRPKGSRSGLKVPCHCTRTRWAVAAIALLLTLALAIGLSVGVPMVMRRSKGPSSTSGYNGTATMETNRGVNSSFTSQNTSSLTPPQNAPEGSAETNTQSSMDLTLQPVPIPSDLYRTKLIPSPYDGVPIMRTTEGSCKGTLETRWLVQNDPDMIFPEDKAIRMPCRSGYNGTALVRCRNGLLRYEGGCEKQIQIGNVSIVYVVRWVNQTDARASCRERGGELLTLASEAQREAIAKESIALEAHTWIGLEAVDRKPTIRKYDYKWLSNARSPIEDWWGPHEPNMHYPEEGICAEIRGLSKELNDAPCHWLRPFACQIGGCTDLKEVSNVSPSYHGCSEVALPAVRHAAWVPGECDATPLGATCTARCTVDGENGTPQVTCRAWGWGAVQGACV